MTIPQMTTVIEFYVIVNMITMLSWVFAYILVMTKGGPGNSTWVLEYFIYQKAFPYSQMQIASAAAVLLLVFASGSDVPASPARAARWKECECLSRAQPDPIGNPYSRWTSY